MRKCLYTDASPSGLPRLQKKCHLSLMKPEDAAPLNELPQSIDRTHRKTSSGKKRPARIKRIRRQGTRLLRCRRRSHRSEDTWCWCRGRQSPHQLLQHHPKPHHRPHPPPQSRPPNPQARECLEDPSSTDHTAHLRGRRDTAETGRGGSQGRRALQPWRQDGQEGGKQRPQSADMVKDKTPESRDSKQR